MMETVETRAGGTVYIDGDLVGRLARAIWQVQFHRENPDATPEDRNREWAEVREHHIRYTLDALRMVGQQGVYLTK